MKISASLLLICFLTGYLQAGNIYAQSHSDEPAPEAWFDFWLGTWDLTWEDADGTESRGTNHIERILNGRVIKENFEAHSGAYEGYVGKSYSVYVASEDTWKQTWVDNNGGYLDFEGERDGDRRMFKRSFINPAGQEIHQRMVFYDITDQSLTWDWEISDDQGETWQLRWRIFYERAD